MRRLIVAGLTVVLATGLVLGQDKAPAAPASAPAAVADVVAMKQQRADADKQRAELQAKWNDRVAAIAKQDAVVKAQAPADEADAKYRKFVQSDPKLEDLRKGIQTAGTALQAAIEKAAAEDKEGSANRATRTGLLKTGYEHDYQIGLLDFEYERKVKRIVGEDPAVAGARQAIGNAESAVRDAEYKDAKLQDLRHKSEIARRRLTVAQEDAKTDAYKQALSAVQAANKAQADAVGALASRKALEDAKDAAEALYKSKMDADDECKSLRAERAKLLKDRAELDYQISMVENKLQNGVSRRIAREPDVSKANDAVGKADAAFRQETESDAKVAEARKIQQDAQKQFQSQEQALKATQAVADASKAFDAVEAALDNTRKAAVQKAQEAVTEARKKEADLFAAKLAVDASAKVVQDKRTGIVAVRDADQKRIQELDAAYATVRDRVAKENADVAKAREAVSAANAAYEKAVKESEAPALDKARNDARAAARKVLDEAVATDEACKALKPQIDAANTKVRDLDREIRKAEAPAPKTAPAPVKTDAAKK